jgi:hypothetical protein
LNPCTLISQIDIDGPQIKHVKNNKGLVGNIREALIVMTTTSYSDFQAYTFGTKNCGLNVRVVSEPTLSKPPQSAAASWLWEWKLNLRFLTYEFSTDEKLALLEV